MSKQAQPRNFDQTEWKRLTSEFAAANPHYQKPDGAPNFYQICNAAGGLGYEFITPDNWIEVATKLVERVTANAAQADVATPVEQEQEQEHAGRTIVEIDIEAASSNFFWAIGKDNRFEVQTTIRGCMTDDQLDAHLQMVIAELSKVSKLGGRGVAKYGYNKYQQVDPPLPDGVVLQSHSAQSVVRPPQFAPPAPVSPAPPAPPMQAQPAQTGGELACAMIEVGTAYKSGKTQLQFHCSGEEKPLKYTRAVNDMVTLLAPLGFTAAHITVGTKYPINCFVRWTPDGQYKNVVSVRPA